MQDPNPLRGTAITLGVIGLAVIAAGLVMVLFGDQTMATPEVGVLVRVGAILLALSLVLPGLKRPSTTTMLIIGVGLVLILVRPALIWAGLIGWVAWLLSGRRQRE